METIGKSRNVTGSCKTSLKAARVHSMRITCCITNPQLDPRLKRAAVRGKEGKPAPSLSVVKATSRCCLLTLGVGDEHSRKSPKAFRVA